MMGCIAVQRSFEGWLRVRAMFERLFQGQVRNRGKCDSQVEILVREEARLGENDPLVRGLYGR
jgi:hypothetical protein